MRFQEILLTSFLVCLPVALKAQLSKDDILKNLTEIKSLELSDDNSSGYDVMAQKIGEARIVLLGEQTHGHGTTFIAKTKIIKYLIENKGFDVVAFESSFYEINKIWESDLAIEKKLSVTRTEIYPAWSASEELDLFFDFIKEANVNGKRVDLTGFDCKHDLPYGQKNYIVDFHTFLLKTKIPIVGSSEYLKFKPILETLIKLKMNFREDASSRPNQTDYRLFNDVLDSTKNQLNNIEKTEEVEFWIQEVKSLKKFAQSTWVTSKLKGAARLATRDSAMAENLIWLAANKFRNRKIIVWAASYHIAKEKQELSFNGIDSKSIELLGNMVNLRMPGQVYSLNIIGGSGTYGEWFKQKYYKYPINITKGSLEMEFVSMPYKYAFIDIKNLPNKDGFLMAGTSHNAMKANWNKVFDGVIYIKSMSPPTYTIR